jgi:hypothetical protein
MSSENKNESGTTPVNTHPLFNSEVGDMLKTLFSQLNQPEEPRRVRIREDGLPPPVRGDSVEDDLSSESTENSEDLTHHRKMRIFADLAFAHQELCKTFSRLCEEEDESSSDEEDEEEDE